MEVKEVEITNKDVSEFQALYKSKFGKELDYQAAREKLTMLLLQVKTVYQPVTTEQLEELARRDAMKADAEAFAELLYDIYQDKKRKSRDNT